MERMTYYDSLNKCYKVKAGTDGRSIVQELGIYEDILEEDIEKAENVQDVRAAYFKKGVKLNPYWEKMGRA